MRKRVIAICTACSVLAGTAAAGSQAARLTDPEPMAESVTEAETAHEAGDTEETSGDLLGKIWDALGEAAGKAGELAGTAADKAGELAGTAVDKAGELAGTAVDKAGEAVDEAGKAIGEADDIVGELIDSAVDKVSEAVGGVVDTVRETVESALEKAEETAVKVQETAEELSEEISETAQKAREDAERIARKWGRVSAYLKEKISHTDITPEEWETLERGYFRAVDNAYRQGWFGRTATIWSVRKNADFVFRTIKFTYQYIKGEITAVDYAESMLKLAGEDQTGILLKLLTGMLPVEEARKASQIIETVLPIVVGVLAEAEEETETDSVSSLPDYSE